MGMTSVRIVKDGAAYFLQVVRQRPDEEARVLRSYGPYQKRKQAVAARAEYLMKPSGG